MISQDSVSFALEVPSRGPCRNTGHSHADYTAIRLSTGCFEEFMLRDGPESDSIGGVTLDELVSLMSQLF